MTNVFKTYGFFAKEFAHRRFKLMMYNDGMLSLCQRLLSLMTEEDAFWTIVGLAKAFNNVFVLDFKDDCKNDHLEQYIKY